jgi:hypothetical protein
MLLDAAAQNFCLLLLFVCMFYCLACKPTHVMCSSGLALRQFGLQDNKVAPLPYSMSLADYSCITMQPLPCLHDPDVMPNRRH